jgi:hypothetical protein
VRDTCHDEADLRQLWANVDPRVRRTVLHEGVARRQRSSIAAIQFDRHSTGQHHREIDRWSAVKSRSSTVNVLRRPRE